MLLPRFIHSRQFVIAVGCVVEIGIIVETVKEGIDAAHAPTTATAAAADSHPSVAVTSICFAIGTVPRLGVYPSVVIVIVQTYCGWRMFGQSTITRRAHGHGHRSCSWFMIHE